MLSMTRPDPQAKVLSLRTLIKKKVLAILTAFLAMAFGLDDLVRFYKGLHDRYTLRADYLGHLDMLQQCRSGSQWFTSSYTIVSSAHSPVSVRMRSLTCLV